MCWVLSLCDKYVVCGVLFFCCALRVACCALCCSELCRLAPYAVLLRCLSISIAVLSYSIVFCLALCNILCCVLSCLTCFHLSFIMMLHVVLCVVSCLAVVRILLRPVLNCLCRLDPFV